MKQAVIDRFEGDVAVCEDCETGLVNLNLPRDQLDLVPLTSAITPVGSRRR